MNKPETLEKRYLGKVTKKMIQFMKGLTKMEPAERMTAAESLQNPYFDGYAEKEKDARKPPQVPYTHPFGVVARLASEHATASSCASGATHDTAVLQRAPGERGGSQSPSGGRSQGKGCRSQTGRTRAPCSAAGGSEQWPRQRFLPLSGWTREPAWGAPLDEVPSCDTPKYPNVNPNPNWRSPPATPPNWGEEGHPKGSPAAKKPFGHKLAPQPEMRAQTQHAATRARHSDDGGHNDDSETLHTSRCVAWGVEGRE